MKRLFRFRGRVPRSAFWWTLILSGAAFVILFVFLDATLGRASTLVLYPPFFWIAAAAAVKRMRDRGKSPAWLLVALVPVLGPLWLFVDLGLLRGTPGENHYGPDPLAIDSDYLTVNINRP
jgi:uncharacterized membrane protein YhaH (DUF805 family)